LEEIVRLWPIAGLAGAALLLIAGRLFFWTRHFLRRDDRSPADAGRRRREAVSAAGKRVVLIEGIATLAAAIGLAATFLDLRNGTGGSISADAERLSRLFAPALSGLGVFVLSQGALGLFRSWADSLKAETVLVPPAPVGQSPDILPSGDGVPPPRRPRRPATPPAPPSARESFLKVAVLSACLLGSVALHGAILYIALRVQTTPPPSREPERAGVFAARIVAPPHDLPAPALDIREEVPPPPPPPPPPKSKEPPPVEAPKAETPEPAALTERPKPEPAAEKPKPEAAPPAPAPVAEAREPDPPAPRAEAKESEHPKPAPGAPPPPAKVTETPKDPGAAPAPETAPPAPAAAPASLPSAGAEPAVLGFGDPPKARDKAEAPPGGDARASGISTMKDYRQFLAREMKSGATEGQYVPNLRFGDNKAQENREIMRYFGMELIAYPRNQKFYVYIDPEQGLYSRSNDFAFIRNFSSRAIFRTSPYFDALRAEAARKVDVPADTLVVAQLLKPSSAAYIGWKESECAKRAGVPLEGVDACDATFVKTPFGVWIVRIDRLLLKDGRTLTVDDFEWTKVASAAGGER
jgi:hypothetical protein